MGYNEVMNSEFSEMLNEISVEMDWSSYRIRDEIKERGVVTTQATINRIQLGQVEYPRLPLADAIRNLHEEIFQNSAA